MGKGKERKYVWLRILELVRCVVLVSMITAHCVSITYINDSKHDGKVLKNMAILFVILLGISLVMGMAVLCKPTCLKYWAWRGVLLNIIVPAMPWLFDVYLMTKGQSVQLYMGTSMFVLDIVFFAVFFLLTFCVVSLLFWGYEHNQERDQYEMMSGKENTPNVPHEIVDESRCS